MFDGDKNASGYSEGQNHKTKKGPFDRRGSVTSSIVSDQASSNNGSSTSIEKQLAQMEVQLRQGDSKGPPHLWKGSPGVQHKNKTPKQNPDFLVQGFSVLGSGHVAGKQ